MRQSVTVTPLLRQHKNMLRQSRALCPNAATVPPKEYENALQLSSIVAGMGAGRGHSLGRLCFPDPNRRRRTTYRTADPRDQRSEERRVGEECITKTKHHK